jgi:6,7-dimethyl-8-ribityllumazine synthase
MAIIEKNLSSFNPDELPDASQWKVGIVVSEWNHEITDKLLSGALEVLKQAGLAEESLITRRVPGSFELPFGAQVLIEQHKVDGVICLGSVIRGETSHFDYVCQASSQGILEVSLKHNRPVIFGVLTDDNIDQSRARSGGELGNKGTESAVSMLKMISLSKEQADTWGID